MRIALFALLVLGFIPVFAIAQSPAHPAPIPSNVQPMPPSLPPSHPSFPSTATATSVGTSPEFPSDDSQRVARTEPSRIPDAATIPNAATQGRSLTEIYLSLAVLVFGILLLMLEVAVIFRQRQGWGSNSMRIVGLTLVVIAGVFLITAGYSESQIAPMIGLLGTIVGYLLGKSDSRHVGASSNEQHDQSD